MSERAEYRGYLEELLRREAVPAHKYGHQVRLYALACEIGAGLAYDDDVVFAAVWLHDLGVFEGNRPSDLAELTRWNHVAYAVERGREILQTTDFPAEKIPRVLRVIEEHQPGDTATSVEASMVRDADILEQLGAIAVLRTAAKLGSDTRFTHFEEVRAYLQDRLRTLPGKLNLERSRLLAAPREKALQDFLASLDAEAGPGLG